MTSSCIHMFSSSLSCDSSKPFGLYFQHPAFRSSGLCLVTLLAFFWVFFLLAVPDPAPALPPPSLSELPPEDELEELEKDRSGHLSNSISTYSFAAALLGPSGYGSSEATKNVKATQSMIFFCRKKAQICVGEPAWMTTRMRRTTLTTCLSV